MSKDTEELKPCPFCGGEAMTINPFANRFYIMCKKCFSRTDIYRIGTEARDTWNSRALAPAQEHAEELYEGLSSMLNVTGDIFEAMTLLFYDLQSSLRDEPKRWRALIEKIEDQECSHD